MIQEIKFWAYQRIKRYGEHSKAMLQLCNTAWGITKSVTVFFRLKELKIKTQFFTHSLS